MVIGCWRGLMLGLNEREAKNRTEFAAQIYVDALRNGWPANQIQGMPAAKVFCDGEVAARYRRARCPGR